MNYKRGEVHPYVPVTLAEMQEEVYALRSQVKTLGEALEWYADTGNYQPHLAENSYTAVTCNVWSNMGERARAVLLPTGVGPTKAEQEIEIIKGIIGHPGTDSGLAWDCPTSEVVRYTHHQWLEQTHDLGQKVIAVEIERDNLQKKLEEKTTEAEKFNSERRLARRRLDEIVAALSALDSPDLVEHLAALSHSQWAGWAQWMIDKWHKIHEASEETYQERWDRQIHTMYADLSEAEKESDRIEAKKMLAVISAILPKAVREYADQNTLLFGLVEAVMPEVHAADHLRELRKRIRWQECEQPICRRAQEALGIRADSGPNNAA